MQNIDDGGMVVNPILVVDDNEQIVDILSQYIKKEGWPMLAARTGEEALGRAVADSAGYHAAGDRRAGGLPPHPSGIERSDLDDYRERRRCGPHSWTGYRRG